MKRLLPLVSFILIAVIIWGGLSLNPQQIPSPYINKPVPKQLPPLFKGHISLLNVFASWCGYCLAEHSILNSAAQIPNLKVYGLNYKDDPLKAKAWLAKHGNPYSFVINDQEGKIAMELGVYGTPETFLIDKEAIIRYKVVGPISVNKWNTALKPKIMSLLNED